MQESLYPTNTSAIKDVIPEGGTAPARNSSTLARITGGLLFVVVVGLLITSLLELSLGISEHSAADAFTVYQHQQILLFITYYSFMMLGLLSITIVLLLDHLFAQPRTPMMLIATTCGVLAGLMQAVGASRWLILLPSLAKTYADPQTSAAVHAAIQIMYQAVSFFLGITAGEFLYYIFIGIWSILFGITLLRAPQWRAWVGWLGILAGSCLLIASFEQINLETMFLLIWLIVGRLLWTVWLVSLAALLLLRRRGARA